VTATLPGGGSSRDSLCGGVPAGDAPSGKNERIPGDCLDGRRFFQRPDIGGSGGPEGAPVAVSGGLALKVFPWQVGDHAHQQWSVQQVGGERHTGEAGRHREHPREAVLGKVVVPLVPLLL
jgi:hypothetical protein